MFQLKNLFLLFTAFLVFCSGNTNKKNDTTKSSIEQEPTKIEKPDQSRTSSKWALLVGINEYKSPQVPDLRGCVNDVMNMKSLLITKFEFPEQNIHTLTDQNATHKAIVEVFQKHLIAKAKPNDIVVFHYSGHGSQMKDKSNDEDDGLDETIVPTNSRQRKVFDISDDEINGLLRKLSRRTKNVTVILDACHSGTAVRAAESQRNIPPDDREPPEPPPYAYGQRGVGQGHSDIRMSNLNYVLISACLSKQLAREHYADGEHHGALTYHLINELRKSGAGVTYRDVMDRVKGNIMSKYFNQNPQLEGTELDQFVFSDSTSIAQPYILASPLRLNQVKLEAGQIHGLTNSSIFHIYPPDTKKFDESIQTIAKVKLTKVNGFSSEGKIIAGNQIPEFSRAVERQHYYPDQKLLIYYKDLSTSPTLTSIKNELDDYNYIKTVIEPTGYHLLLRELDNKIITEWGDTTVVSPPVSINDTDAVLRVVDQINQWAKWFNIFSINNAVSKMKIGLTIQALRLETTRNPYAQIDTANAVIYEGEKFECTIENLSRKDFYISMLDLSTDGSVSVIYPYPEGASELLRAGTSVTKRYETFIPQGKESVIDVIKVFATSTPIDFHYLAQPAIRGGIRGELPQDLDNPLGRLLAQAALGEPRGVKPDPVDLGNWASAYRVFKVKPLR